MRISYTDVTKAKNKTKVTKVTILKSTVQPILLLLISKNDNVISMRNNKIYTHYYLNLNLDNSQDLINTLRDKASALSYDDELDMLADYVKANL
jgi:hypothetical protein